MASERVPRVNYFTGNVEKHRLDDLVRAALEAPRANNLDIELCGSLAVTGKFLDHKGRGYNSDRKIEINGARFVVSRVMEASRTATEYQTYRVPHHLKDWPRTVVFWKGRRSSMDTGDSLRLSFQALGSLYLPEEHVGQAVEEIDDFELSKTYSDTRLKATYEGRHNDFTVYVGVEVSHEASSPKGSST